MTEPLSAVNPYLDNEMQRQLAIYFGNDYTHISRREIEPLLSILQKIKLKYKGTEIWVLLLQHLHDYLHYKDGFRLPRQKVINYIEILMANSPDLAECLVSNLPIIKVPMVMGAGTKRDLNITSVDSSILASASKRSRGETPFYNFSTPAVNAYLATHGKPLRVVSSPSSISSAKPALAYSLLTTSASSVSNDNSKTNTTSQTKKVCHPGSKPINTLTTDQMNQIINSHRQTLNVRIKQEDQNQLSHLERNKLKMAIQRLHLEGKLRALHGFKVSDNGSYLISSPSRSSQLCKGQPIRVKIAEPSTTDHKGYPLQQLQALVDNSSGDVTVKEEPVSPQTSNVNDEPLDMSMKKHNDEESNVD